MARRTSRPLAGALAGAVVAVGAEAGAALLLYTERGLLSSIGFLFAVVLAAFAAGIWAGFPADRPARARWLAAVVAFTIAAVFAEIWSGVQAVRIAGWGRALAVLFLLAQPAYASGALMAALAAGAAARDDGHARLAVGALLGAAGGVLLAAVALIPHFDAGTVFLGCAVALAAAGLWDTRTAGLARPGSGSMRGKVAIVTGVGGRGQVGYALAEALLDDGARVVISGATANVEERASELAGRGEVVGVVADLVQPDQAALVVERARERFGRLDVLFNVAGGLSVIKPLAETAPDEWERELSRNARTTYLLCRAALPLLRESRGAIVNFASPAIFRPPARLAAYTAAKAAVAALTRSLAVEEREHGVRVNALAPGMIDTEQNRRSVPDPDRVRWVTREQVVRAALFLASEAASGITGETIQVLGEGIE